MEEFNFSKWRADKKFVRLLNQYYIERLLYDEAIRNYNKAKQTYRHFSREENQLKEDMKKLRLINGYSDKTDEEWIKYYNENNIPITRMNKNELHKIHAENCKHTKELVKIHQHMFNKAFLALKEFISHYGPF